jgi:ATP-dependent DNA ligase
MKYYYPCKPNPLSAVSKFFAELDRDVSWIAEVKKNGWRCLVYRENKLTLWTSNKTTINEPLKSLRDSLMSVPEQTILDGELINFRTADIKGKLYLFDILIFKGKMIIALPLMERRKYLEEAISETPDIEIAKQVQLGKRKLYYTAIQDEVNEGIVLKKLNSKYLISDTRCLQNPFWLKVKRIEKHIKVGG